MNIKTAIITTLLLFVTSCTSQSTVPTATATALIRNSVPPPATATLVPSETPTLPPTPSDVFGVIPLNSVQAFNIEPIAKAIFDRTLQGYVDAGMIQEFRVDSIAVFPSGDGGLIAEIIYNLRAENDPWPDDFGTAGSDGWITGKCSRFDLVATETEHQLKNKRLCS